MKYSIVVPVYNVEQYLNECLKSLLNQKMVDYEIILIDDGSKDKSGQICDAYAKKYKNVSTIHQKNTGLSGARNRGIDVARGEYVLFVDSDDVIIPNVLQDIDKSISGKPDVIITELYNTSDTKHVDCSVLLFDIPEVSQKDEIIQYIFSQKKHKQASVQYIVRRDLLIKNNICFELGYLHEDNVYTPYMLSFAESFAFYNKIWYVRRYNRADSITSTVNPKRTIDIITLTDKYINGDLLKRYDQQVIYSVFQSMIDSLCSSLSDFWDYPQDAQNRIIDLLDQKNSMIRFGHRIKQRIIYTLIHYCGAKRAFGILKFGRFLRAKK